MIPLLRNLTNRNGYFMKYLLFVFTTSILLAQPSSIELNSLYSPTLSQSKEFNILLPEGYANETDHYPVVYLFRGAVDEWADPSEDNSRRGNIKTVYDTLFSKKAVGKMILVMPGLGAPAAQNEYLYLVNDLIPYIDNHYRTIPTRWFRSMDGFSLGGLIVTNLVAGAPGYFHSAGSYDGTLSLFDNSKFSLATSSTIYSIKQMQLVYHTASVGGNNNTNNVATFTILNSKGIYNALPSFLLNTNAQHNWYYADLHMSITLPLHWKKMQSTSNSLDLTFASNFSDTVISGTTVIPWSRRQSADSITTLLFYSRNGGKNWTKFFSTTKNDSSFQWNTVLLPDGTRYMLKIISAGDTLYGSAITGKFSINNPGNGAPDIEFVHLQERDTISGLYNLQWSAADADGDPLSINIDISYDAGISWKSIAAGVANSGNYFIPSSTMPNGNSVLFRISCTDGTLSTTEISPKLIVYNKRLQLVNAYFEHLSGHSDAIFKAVAVNAESVKSANYTILFKETDGIKSYSVFNAVNNAVVTNATELDGTTEGPLFNGFRLLIQDFPTPMVNPDSTRWISGNSTLEGEIRLIDIITEAGTIHAHPFPSDYEIRFHSTIVDTTLSLFGATEQTVTFLVWNTTLQKKTKFLFVDFDGNGSLSRNDELYFVEYDSVHAPILTWHVQFVGTESAILPVSGNILKIKIMKPLTSADRYQFIYYPPLSANVQNSTPQSFALLQNFPNPFNPITSITFSIPKQDAVSLTVYDILGRMSKMVLNQIMAPGVYTIQWDGTHFSSGMYFYRLRSGDAVQTKRMLLLK